MMGGRYIISGTQLGLLRGSLDDSAYKEKIKNQLDTIYNKQFIGDSDKSIKEDIISLSKWCNKLKINIPENKDLLNRDWDGMSARTLDAVYNYGFAAHPSRPYDPSDFRRCYNWYILNFKDNKEGFKTLLKEVVKRHPIWKPTADNWDKMVELYLEETKNETSFGDAPKLYKFMQEINKGGD